MAVHFEPWRHYTTDLTHAALQNLTTPGGKTIPSSTFLNLAAELHAPRPNTTSRQNYSRPRRTWRLNAMLRTRNGTRPGGVTEPNNDRNKTGPCGCTRLCLALPCGTTEQPVPLPGGRTVLGRTKLNRSDPCGMTSQIDSFRSLAAIRFTPNLSDTLRHDTTQPVTPLRPF